MLTITILIYTTLLTKERSSNIKMTAPGIMFLTVHSSGRGDDFSLFIDVPNDYWASQDNGFILNFEIKESIIF